MKGTSSEEVTGSIRLMCVGRSGVEDVYSMPPRWQYQVGSWIYDLVTCTGNRNLRVMVIWMVLKAKSLDACSKD